MTARTEQRENVAIRVSVMRKLRKHVFAKFDGKMRGHIAAEIETAVIKHIVEERAARANAGAAGVRPN